MPVIYRCKVCGFILDVFVRVGQNSHGVPPPSEIISNYGGMCPRCGSPLQPPTLRDIVVKPDGPGELLAALEEAQRHGQRLRWLRPLLEQLRPISIHGEQEVAADA